MAKRKTSGAGRRRAGNRRSGGHQRRATVRRSPQDNVRVSAAWVVERTLDSRAPVETFLAPVMVRFDERDLALLQELVYGTLRWLRRLDDVITRAASRGLDAIEKPLWAPLRIAAYQLLFLDRVPAHAAVHEAVEQAHQLTHRGAASFVNAVLRRIARASRLEDWPVEIKDPARRLAVEWSHPDLLAQRWLQRFGESGARDLMRNNNRHRPLQLLAFRHRGGREVVAEELIEAGLDVEPSQWAPLGLTVRRGNPLTTECFRHGRIYIQDEISQLSALLPPPRAGERVLDAAAAPGGKSLALYAWEPEVQLTLADLSASRLGRLRENLQRLDLDLPLTVADAGAPPWAAPFDRVILDLPCSGTGTLRKNPELKWRLSGSEIGRMSSTSRRLLKGSAPLVAPGGLLVAITCSVEVEENEEVVNAFLADLGKDFRPAPLADWLAPPAARGVVAPGLWRVLPEDDHDGFTVHVMERFR
ncbi:MAG: transcription antitermination factor NusB [Acidobacteriota bacterium]